MDFFFWIFLDLSNSNNFSRALHFYSFKKTVKKGKRGDVARSEKNDFSNSASFRGHILEKMEEGLE